MDLKEIKRVIQMVEEAQISHLSLEMDGIKIEVKKELASANGVTHHVMLPQHHVAPHIPQPETPLPSQPALPAIPKADENCVAIKSQMVGTFYDTPKPGSPPFVKVGDSIKTGQVLCIIEAMKLFNEIESERAGVIEKVCVENGSPVEFGQDLFILRIS